MPPTWTHVHDYTRHPLRALRDRDREGHDRPPRGPQRLPAGDRVASSSTRSPGSATTPSIGCVLLTGAGDKAFCSGGDQRYKATAAATSASDGIARLNVLDLQRQIRSLPIPVIALVNGYAIGGGHVLHVVCDLSIASENAIFGQVGPRVGSFDAGFGVGLLARLVGDKKAKEIWFLCRQYSAARGARDGPRQRASCRSADLEAEGVRWASEILDMSPTAIRFLKSAFLVATRTAWPGSRSSPATRRGCTTRPTRRTRASPAFLEKRTPDFRKFPRRPVSRPRTR